MSSRLASALMLLFSAAATNAAFANCAPLIDALEKADQQARVARFDPWGRNPAVDGKPVVARLGKISSAEQVGSDPTGESLLSSLRGTPPKSGAACDAAVHDKIRGVATLRIRVVDPTAGDKSEVTVWIATASGLPVYHEVKGPWRAGFAWVYGDAVRESVSRLARM